MSVAGKSRPERVWPSTLKRVVSRFCAGGDLSSFAASAPFLLTDGFKAAAEQSTRPVYTAP